MSTRWLTPAERQAWLGLLSTGALLDLAMDTQLNRDAGLTHTTYSILAGLSDAPEQTLHMHQLALLTSNSPSRLSHAMTRMQDRGWVTRSPCPKNGRAVHATLTAAGRAVIRAAAPGHVDTVRGLVFDRLTPTQVNQLSRITASILEGLAGNGYAVPPLSLDD